MPRYNIIITSYNSAAFIGEAAESALAQDCTDREIIVVDDASIDASVEILKKYGNAIKLVALDKNGGACAARNLGAALATGDFLVFLDGDDLMLPWALKIYDRIIDLKSPTLILCTMLHFIELFSSANAGSPPHDIKVVDYETFYKKDRPYRASASALVIERLSFHDVDGFSSDAWPMEDAHFVLKRGHAGRTINIVAPPTTAYRMHANTVSRDAQRLINAVHVLIRKESSNQYLSGPAYRTERRAVLGGIVYYWIKKTCRQKLYMETLRLIAVGWPMVFFAIFQRAAAIAKGRRPVEIIHV
jgi:glycosyltransferase involved in cell wall biosynthesis